MPVQKRSKLSTVTNSVHLMSDIATGIEPNESLSAEERKYFDLIVASREISSFSQMDITLAANLAKMQVQFNAASAYVGEHGRTEINQRGTRVVNAELAAMLQLAGTIRAASAVLGLTASQKGLTTGSQRQRNEQAQQAHKVIARSSMDSLLAGFDD